jgi:Integral membrane protein CcmA involved in cell shape determination
MPFGKGAKEEIVRDSAQSYIGEGTTVEGKIVCEGSLRVDGKVKGEIEAKGIITVGEKGLIESNVKAGEVQIMGVINGNVISDRKVEIYSTGKLIGDVQTPKIAIEEGGILDGKCSMVTNKENLVSKEKKGDIQK